MPCVGAQVEFEGVQEELKQIALDQITVQKVSVDATWTQLATNDNCHCSRMLHSASSSNSTRHKAQQCQQQQQLTNTSSWLPGKQMGQQ